MKLRSDSLVCEKFKVLSIPIIKLNYNFENNAFRQHEGHLRLSNDEKNLYINLNKIKLNHEFMADPDLQKIKERHEYHIRKMKILEMNGLPTTSLLEHKHTTSSASCLIEDIIGLTYGAFNSRFWMCRKHINFVKNSNNQMPFLSW